MAWLRYAGRSVTVVAVDGRALGRILPLGYTQGQPDDSGLFEAWTAKHPMVHVPSDTITSPEGGLPFEDCVALILGEVDD